MMQLADFCCRVCHWILGMLQQFTMATAEATCMHDVPTMRQQRLYLQLRISQAIADSQTSQLEERGPQLQHVGGYILGLQQLGLCSIGPVYLLQLQNVMT